MGTGSAILWVEPRKKRQREVPVPIFHKLPAKEACSLTGNPHVKPGGEVLNSGSIPPVPSDC